jgi:hypothetical protein
MGISDPASLAGGPASGQDPGVVATSPSGGQIGSRPLGFRTGAPPRTSLRAIQVIPFVAVGKVIQGQAQQPTRLVENDAASRSVVLTAPFVGFSIYVSGDSDVQPGNALRLPPGLPYEIPLVGHQGLYAVTDSPVYLTVNVQVAAYLVGDRERL